MTKKKEIIPANKGLMKLPKLTDVFSEYDIRGIFSWDRLAVIGKNNLGFLLSRLRSSEKGWTNEIQKLQERKNLFTEAKNDPSGIPANYFKKLAQDYDNPTFKPHEIGKREGSWSDDLEPLTIDSVNRKADTTTFNICGWCKHTGGGTCRYQYHITSNCDLLSTVRTPIAGEEVKDYSDGKSDKHHYYHNVVFNTPCLLSFLTTEQCDEAITNLEQNIEVSKAHREEVREAIKKVQEFEAAAKSDKPWLVCNRAAEYMNVGDPVMTYLPGFGKGLIVEGDWAEGYGTFGYRHHDGVMSFQTIFPIHDNYEFHEGRG
ncbi:MAG TPA: hypothetical protein VF941_16265, partial [Clostridia bacterium]